MNSLREGALVAIDCTNGISYIGKAVSKSDKHDSNSLVGLKEYIILLTEKLSNEMGYNHTAKSEYDKCKHSPYMDFRNISAQTVLHYID